MECRGVGGGDIVKALADKRDDVIAKGLQVRGFVRGGGSQKDGVASDRRNGHKTGGKRTKIGWEGHRKGEQK